MKTILKMGHFQEIKMPFTRSVKNYDRQGWSRKSKLRPRKIMFVPFAVQSKLNLDSGV